MARRNTIHEERWRVQAVLTTARGTQVTFEKNFKDGEAATRYYEALYMPGQEKLLKVRVPAAQCYGLVRQAYMREDERRAS